MNSKLLKNNKWTLRKNQSNSSSIYLEDGSVRFPSQVADNKHEINRNITQKEVPSWSFWY